MVVKLLVSYWTLRIIQFVCMRKKCIRIWAMNQNKCIDSIVTENNAKFQIAELISECKFLLILDNEEFI